ncbi:telomere-associated protein Tap [Streptacidiphilus anmyonensis]|uniref:telomere-associated protein Tap n=1 Tax=Streptacidiphilus anmyonensis TaxID=405782 RepID=UPI0005AB4182|nr:helix-turn-helix domain-containing protein [Streptacidiphilus anmyonensis]
MPKAEKSEDELFAAVDALLEGPQEVLPDPTERARLREAAGVPQSTVAQALSTTTQTVKNWESGRSEPRPPRLQAYKRLLDGWAAQFPAPAPAAPAEVAVPAAFTPAAESAPLPAAVERLRAAEVRAGAPAREDQDAAVRPGTRAGSSRRPATAKTTPAAARPLPDSRFAHGPLAVLDGDGTAYAVGGLVLTCEATTLAQLVTWTLSESGLGAPRLNRYGKDGDPLIVLTASAAKRFGLPSALLDEQVYPGKRLPANHVDVAQRAQRLPEDHSVVKALLRAKWNLTKRGFGPWARVYRKAEGSERQCVQFAILPWGALDPRHWGAAAELPAPELARVLGTYATRVLTPRGSTAVTGLELMTALRPPTRAVKDESTGGWKRAFNPGALIEPVDPAPPEAPKEHSKAQGWTGGFIDEEAYQWTRPIETIGDAEMLQPYCVGLDINTAFLAGAARLNVGLCAPERVKRPVFDKKVPGSWLVDLSGLETDPRLPSPFTPSGQRPDGAGWYATPTVAYAVELGLNVEPIEAWVRPTYGAYLDPWHDHLREAYVSTMANAGIPVEKDADEHQFLAALSAHQILKRHQGDDVAALRAHLTEAGLVHLAQFDDGQLLDRAERHRQIDMVLTAIKHTVKGGIGKLRERPRGLGFKPGESWPALERPTWRPDIRAAVIAKARVNMHRKMANMVKHTGRYPLGVATDCVVYASPTPDPFGFLPLAGNGRVLPGVFRLGATPGLAKIEGVQSMLWAISLLEHDPQPLNPARHIKGDGDSVLDDGE